MSRRVGRGGRPRHLDHRGGPRPHDPTRPGRPALAAAPTDVPLPDGASAAELEADTASAPVALEPFPRAEEPGPVAPTLAPDDPAPADVVAHVPETIDPLSIAAAPPARPARTPEPTRLAPDRMGGSCTTAQLRRFIKSRAYVPMHEIRRRFAITSEDDDVTGVELDRGRIFVGLPAREGQMLGELLRGGEVGFELQLDPTAPIVVGVYPMRPVARG